MDNAVSVTSSGNYQTIDVRLIQLRNLLAGTRPQIKPIPFSRPIPRVSPEQRSGERRRQPGPGGRGQGHERASTALFHASMASRTFQRSIPRDTIYTGFGAAIHVSYLGSAHLTPPVGGRWGEASVDRRRPVRQSSVAAPPAQPGEQTNYANPVRKRGIRSTSPTCSTPSPTGDPSSPRRAADDNYNAFDVFGRRGSQRREVGDSWTSTRPPARLMLPQGRADAAVRDAGRHQRQRPRSQYLDQPQSPAGRGRSDYGPDNFGRVQFSSYFRPAGAAGGHQRHDTVLGDRHSTPSNTTPGFSESPSPTAITSGPSITRMRPGPQPKLLSA